MKNNLVKNKFLYKFVTVTVKYLPSILALFQIIMTCLNFFGIVVPILPFIGGTSFLFLLLLYLLSYLFQYCSLYRMPLGYNLTVSIVALLRALGILPIDLNELYRLIAIITGVFISLFVYFAYKYRNHSKLGGIKQFCDKYLDCKF